MMVAAGAKKTKRVRKKIKSSKNNPFKTKRASLEVSAGGIVYSKRRGVVKVVLVGLNKPYKTWRLPKGHVEKGERFIEAATREVSEESGILGSGGPKLGSANFYFVHPVNNKLIHKYVHYFLFKKQSGSVALHDKEYDLARWFSLEKAIKMATFKNDKIMLRRARELIKKRQKKGKQGGTSRSRVKSTKSLDLGIYQPGGESS